MSLILDIDKFTPEYIYFVQKVKNNVKQNSYFSRIIYSNELFALKNIYFSFNLINTTFKEQYLKTIIYFNENPNKILGNTFSGNYPIKHRK